MHLPSLFITGCLFHISIVRGFFYARSCLPWPTLSHLWPTLASLVNTVVPLASTRISGQHCPICDVIALVDLVFSNWALMLVCSLSLTPGDLLVLPSMFDDSLEVLLHTSSPSTFVIWYWSRFFQCKIVVSSLERIFGHVWVFVSGFGVCSLVCVGMLLMVSLSLHSSFTYVVI